MCLSFPISVSLSVCIFCLCLSPFLCVCVLSFHYFPQVSLSLPLSVLLCFSISCSGYVFDFSILSHLIYLSVPSPPFKLWAFRGVKSSCDFYSNLFYRKANNCLKKNFTASQLSSRALMYKSSNSHRFSLIPKSLIIPSMLL